jgi:hypothetical protein
MTVFLHKREAKRKDYIISEACHVPEFNPNARILSDTL